MAWLYRSANHDPPGLDQPKTDPNEDIARHIDSNINIILDRTPIMARGTSAQEWGIRSETRARKYLEQRGLVFIAANYHSRYGEIDLIMRDDEHIVFVEVRARSGNRFGGAAASIVHEKQNRIKICAQFYLQRELSNHLPACRFDVIAIDLNQPKEEQLNWIKNAF